MMQRNLNSILILVIFLFTLQEGYSFRGQDFYVEGIDQYDQKRIQIGWQSFNAEDKNNIDSIKFYFDEECGEQYIYGYLRANCYQSYWLYDKPYSTCSGANKKLLNADIIARVTYTNGEIENYTFTIPEKISLLSEERQKEISCQLYDDRCNKIDRAGDLKEIED
jgi:hypothetical protein